jgi:hypothetical protein
MALAHVCEWGLYKDTVPHGLAGDARASLHRYEERRFMYS